MFSFLFWSNAEEGKHLVFVVSALPFNNWPPKCKGLMQVRQNEINSGLAAWFSNPNPT